MSRPAATVIVGVSFIFIALAATTARAQCDYSLTTYRSSELDGGGVVLDLTVFDDGGGPALIAAGIDLVEFTQPNSSYPWCNVAKWTPETGWVPLGHPGEISSASQVQEFDGSLYAYANGVHRWTGSEWVSAGDGLAGSVVDFAIFDDGSGSGESLFAGTNIYSTSPPYWTGGLFKLEGGAWQQIALFSNRVGALEVFGGSLIVAGGFTSVDNLPVNHIAEWDGRQWTDLGHAGNMTAGDLDVMQIDGAPVLVACGNFELEASGGKPADVVYWNGSDWLALPPIDALYQDGVGPMGVWDDGAGVQLYVSVTSEYPSSGDSHATLYRYDAHLQQWIGVAGTYYLPSSFIAAMQPYRDGASEHPTLCVGGKFTQFGGLSAYHLARVLPQPDGGIEPLPSDPKSLGGTIEALASFDHEGLPTLHAGGRLRGLPDTVGNVLVARFDGDAWATIGTGSGRVDVLRSLDDGNGQALYAGGSFGRMQPSVGQAPVRIAKWDGTLWHRMGSLSSNVRALCMHDDGTGPTIYCALVNDTIVKWNGDSQTWSVIPGVFTSGGTFGPDLYALESFDDGSGAALYVAGRFSTVNGTPANNIARWAGATQGWSAVGAGRPGAVGVLHVHDDGSGPRLLASADINQPGAIAAWNGAKWSDVGDADVNGVRNTRSMTTFDDGSGPSLMVGTLGSVARWNGTFWAFLPVIEGHALAWIADTLYIGAGPFFSEWAPGGDQLAIGDQSPGRLLRSRLDRLPGGGGH